MLLAPTRSLDAKVKAPPSRRSRLRVLAPRACLRCMQQQSLELLPALRMQHSSSPAAAVVAECRSSGREPTGSCGSWPSPPRRSATVADAASSRSGHATFSGRMHAALGDSGSSQQSTPSGSQANAQDPGGAASADRGELASEAPPPQPPAALEGSQPERTEQDSLGVRMALSALRFYKQGISPLMPSVCRFLPTCSQYSVDAYKHYGVARGTVLTAWRLLRCNPWGGRGYDPVTWPPPGLPAAVFQVDGSAEVAVVLGAAAFVWLVQSALFG